MVALVDYGILDAAALCFYGIPCPWHFWHYVICAHPFGFHSAFHVQYFFCRLFIAPFPSRLMAALVWLFMSGCNTDDMFTHHSDNMHAVGLWCRRCLEGPTQVFDDSRKFLLIIHVWAFHSCSKKCPFCLDIGSSLLTQE